MPSAVIQAMRYEPAERQLMIMFPGVRGAYLYEGVGPAEWAAFRDAESKGTYLNSIFKPRHHPYRHLLPTLAIQARQSARPRPTMNAEGESLIWGEWKTLPQNPFLLPERPAAKTASSEAPPQRKKSHRASGESASLPLFREAA